jgi:hypothetical protein
VVFQPSSKPINWVQSIVHGLFVFELLEEF